MLCCCVMFYFESHSHFLPGQSFVSVFITPMRFCRLFDFCLFLICTCLNPVCYCIYCLRFLWLWTLASVYGISDICLWSDFVTESAFWTSVIMGLSFSCVLWISGSVSTVLDSEQFTDFECFAEEDIRFWFVDNLELKWMFRLIFVEGVAGVCLFVLVHSLFPSQ